MPDIQYSLLLTMTTDMRKAFYAGKGSASMSAACKLHLHKVGAGYPAKHEVHIHVPSLDIVLDKSDIDAIQYLVDDITRATSRVAFLLDSAPTILSRARPEQIAGLGDNPGIKLSETTLEESHTKFTKVQLLFEKSRSAHKICCLPSLT